jgi:haloacetate dehalogenase
MPGFSWYDVDADGTRIRTAVAGSGPPLLLLHGHPQTHLTWHKIAPDLARDFTVICADLRGYGDSDKPVSDPEHMSYSKRAMAFDQVAVMERFGFDRFCLVGHDRGARVGHRMALDHPHAVDKLVLIDVAPTLTMYERTDMEFARRYFWWFFLIQPFDLPERLIGADPGYFLQRHISAQIKVPGSVDPQVMAEYERCYADPATQHAICEDYRAAATIDLVHDRADATKRVASPLLVLWGSLGVVGDLYDVPACWREKADNVTGHAIAAGHSPQEEAPLVTLGHLQEFLSNRDGGQMEQSE